MSSSDATAGPPTPPPTRVRLRWSGEGLLFRGGVEGGPEVVVDGAAAAGPAPMQLLLLSLAGCMAIDVRQILEKSRVPLTALEVDVEGSRVASEPRRFERVRLTYRAAGPAPEHQAKLERAVELSRERYCSVLHTLRPDLDLDVRVERA